MADLIDRAAALAAINALPTAGTTPPVEPPVTPGLESVTVVSIDWANPVPHTRLPMTPEKGVAVHFRTGPKPTPSNNPLVVLACGEFTTNLLPRQAALSMSPGFFSDSLDKTLIGSTSPTVTAHFSIDPTAPGYAGYPMLAPNTDYYLSIKVQPGSGTPGQDCSMYADLNKPGGV